jgi:crossover junction endodeoxyribonuclease RuvC
LFESLSEIIDSHQPTVAAIESVFMAKSADAALKLGHARGAAMVACVINDLVVHEYAADRSNSQSWERVRRASSRCNTW